MAGLLIDDPVTLSTALASNRVVPGDVLLLRAGTYAGDFTVAFNGISGSPITIKPYNNERVIIDGRLLINGSNTLVDGLEFTYSGWQTRTTDIAGSQPGDIPYSSGIEMLAPFSEVRNCLIYDVAGFGIWTSAKQAKIYGNVVYNIGWNSTTDRGHGHLFYTQNDEAYGRKTYKNNIAFNSFSTGLKIYTVAGKANGFDIMNNTIFNSAVLYAGEDYGMNYWIQANGATGYKFESNRGYHAKATGDPVRIGLYHPAVNVELIGNYWPENLSIVDGSEIVANSGNTLGTVGDVVFVEPNDYISTRAHVTIYNEAGADSVTVDLSTVAGLEIGNTVTAWNVQAGVGNDLQALTLDANKCITVDMQAANRSVAAPIAWTAPATTFPTFGCFVVQKA